MVVVTLYIRKGDPQCEQAINDFDSLREKYPHQLVQVDIGSDAVLEADYGGQVPVAQIGPYKLHTPFTIQDIQVALGAAGDRAAHLEKLVDPKREERLKRGHNLSSADRVSYWLGRHYMFLINLVLALYVGLPFLAPVLARNGANGPARLIYAIYSPLCHQLPFRSWFLYGEQIYYPRDLAGIEKVASYEQFIGVEKIDVTVDRHFIGSEELGYGNGQVGFKVALCQRDIAIYVSLLLMGLLFALSGRRLKALPWYIWVIIGLGPIGLDGVSQLPSLVSTLPQWLVIRESTPLLRTITGTLFGVTTAWYLYPMIEDSMRETRKLIAGKMAVVSTLNAQKSGK